MPELKICTKCNTTKHITEFKKDSRNKSGYSSTCKECANAQSKQYRETHAESIALYYKKYTSEHKRKDRNTPESREKRKVYLDSVREHVRQYERDYRSQKLIIRKRCPKCRKHFTFYKYEKNAIFRCKHCNTILRRSKTLSSNPNHDNANGFRIKVVTA